jgi:hypothetical protein
MTQPIQRPKGRSSLPKTGDRYECERCGMIVEVATDCRFEDGAPEFRCCGQALHQA